MSLSPMEFVTVKYLLDKFKKSACIVSEFLGCARALGGTFIINPYDAGDIAKKIDEAVNVE